MYEEGWTKSGRYMSCILFSRPYPFFWVVLGWISDLEYGSQALHPWAVPSARGNLWLELCTISGTQNEAIRWATSPTAYWCPQPVVICDWRSYVPFQKPRMRPPDGLLLPQHLGDHSTFGLFKNIIEKCVEEKDEESCSKHFKIRNNGLYWNCPS